MSREFEVRFEGSLRGSPVEVWEAITRRTAGWLWPVKYEQRLGGAVTGLTAGGDTVTAWDPPRRLAVRSEGNEGSFNDLTFTLESWVRGTFLRSVHTGVSDVNQYAACERLTAFYCHSLGEYLRYFKGRDATYVSADAPRPGPFATLRIAIGSPERVGDRVRFQVPGLDPIDGEVDYLTEHFIGVRTADALYRCYGRDAFGQPVAVAHHLFAAGVDRDKTDRAWAAWLEGLYG